MDSERQLLKDCFYVRTMDNVRDVVLSRLTLTLWWKITGQTMGVEVALSRIHVFGTVADDSEVVSESEPVEREDVGWGVGERVAIFGRYHEFARRVSNGVRCRVDPGVTFRWFRTAVCNEARSRCR